MLAFITHKATEIYEALNESKFYNQTSWDILGL